MLFMVIETFRGQDVKAVYRHFRDRGRMMPDGLSFVGSWVEASGSRCFQLMECGDVTLLQRWVAEWSPLIEFEIVPVAPGSDELKLAAAKIAAWSGVRVVIAATDTEGVVLGAVEGRAVGTAVRPRAGRLPSRKLWIAFARGAVQLAWSNVWGELVSNVAVVGGTGIYRNAGGDGTIDLTQEGAPIALRITGVS